MKTKASYRWLVLIILALILIGAALWNLLPPYIDRWNSVQEYKKLAEEYVTVYSAGDAISDGPGSGGGEEKEKKKDWWLTDVAVEFDKLKAENPDIIAWLRFDNPDMLDINYPVLYSGDNEKYLRTDFYGNTHIAGSIFLEGLNQPDFSDYYNILYGHNMNNGSMFGSLKKYKEEGFWENNQYFTLYTEDRAYRYQIFSYHAAKNGGNVYKIGYHPDEEYQTFIDDLVESSMKETGIYPEKTDRILTLSTCTGDGYSKRFAVHAVCVDEQTTNEELLEPDGED